MIVRAQGEVVLAIEKPGKPRGGGFVFRNAGRVDVKTLGGTGEHFGGGPLFGPQADLAQAAFACAAEFGKQAPVPLGMHLARDEIHAGNPGAGFLQNALTGQRRPGFQAFGRQAVLHGGGRIIAHLQTPAGIGAHSAPELIVLHGFLV